MITFLGMLHNYNGEISTVEDGCLGTPIEVFFNSNK